MTRARVRLPQAHKDTAPIWRAPETVACRGADISLFYRAEGEKPEARDKRARRAVALCQACHARDECLEAAMDEEKDGGGRHGIRGGLTEAERKTLQATRATRARREREQEQARQEAGEAA